MSFQFLLNSQIYLFETISDVWNNQWDFRSNIFCQWCLIQVVFWTAHRDCQCLRRARQNFLCIGRMGFSMVHFHNFLTYLTLVPIDIVITSARPGKVSCADNGQLGIFVAHFRNFLPQCCATKNCFLVWKSVKGNQERTETTLFANAKVQSISRTRCTSFCVVLCRYVEKVGNSKLKVKMKIKDL